MSKEEPSHVGTKATILMRLVAAGWFAITGFIPALLSFLATSWTWKSYIGSRVFFGFVIGPTVIFALFGAIMGARILCLERKPANASRALGRGAALAAVSLPLFLLGWAIIEVRAAQGAGPLLFASTVFYLMALWGSIRIVPLILIGAFSGWLLYRLNN